MTYKGDLTEANIQLQKNSTHKNISHLLFETTGNLFITFEQ